MSDKCELGKHEYWESAYAEEYKNFTDFGDEGEVWFGEEVLETLITWVDDILGRTFQEKQDIRILEVGCGNGHLLYALHELGYQHLVGTDYSEQSILLAKKVLESKNLFDIHFLNLAQVDDILHSELRGTFDVVLDKGTFDAITLGDQKRDIYPQSILKLLEPNGLLILTSCNFTREELIQEIGSQMEYVDHVKNYKTFTFGGQEGNQVSTLAFKCVKSSN